MALTPTLTDVSGGVLDASRVHANYHSIAYEIRYTDDDDDTLLVDLEVISSGGALAGATTLPVSALPVSLPSGAVVVWWNGVRASLTAPAARGATSLTVSALSGNVPSLTLAYVSTAYYQKDGQSAWLAALPPWKCLANQQLRATLAAGGTSVQVDGNVGGVFAALGVPLDLYIESEGGNPKERVTVSEVGGTDWAISVRNVNGVGAQEHKAGRKVSAVGGGKRLYGFVFAIESDTTYHLRVAVTDPVAGTESVVTFDATTRLDDIPAADSLTPTHYVDGKVGSSGDGSEGDPWKTLEEAIVAANSASGDMVIAIAGAYYYRPNTALTQSTHTITFVPWDSSTCIAAVDDDRERQLPEGFTPIATNPGVPLVYDRYSAPTGAGEAADWAIGLAGSGVWQSQTVNGLTIWYLDLKDEDDAADSRQVYHLSYGATKNAHPELSAHWEHDVQTPDGAGNTLNTLDGWTKLLQNNTGINYGYWQDVNGVGAAGTNTSPARIFLRLRADADPNSGYIWMGVGKRFEDAVTAGFRLNAGTGHRISGIRIRGCGNGIRLEPAGGTAPKLTVIDHCDIEACGDAIRMEGDALTTDATEITGTTIQYNRLQQTGQWSDDPSTPEGRRIPWRGVKQNLPLAAGGEYPVNKVLSAREDNACPSIDHVAHTVIRYNTAIGWQNGFNRPGATQTTPAHGYNQDCYGNHMINICDNPYEFAGPTANAKVWDEFVDNCSNVCELDTQWGPQVYARIRGLEISNYGITDDGATTNIGGGGHALKFGANQPPRPRVWILNNTLWTSKKHHLLSTYPQYMVSGVANNDATAWVWINNIIRGRHRMTNLSANRVNWIVDEANFWGTEAQGMVFDGRTFNKTVTTGTQSLDEWRKWDPYDDAAGGTILRGSLTNQLGGVDAAFVNGAQVIIDAAMIDPVNGDFNLIDLDPEASFVDAGVPVPNLDVLWSSGPVETRHYLGTLPDRGAMEFISPGEPVIPPQTGADTTRSTNTARLTATTRQAR